MTPALLTLPAAEQAYGVSQTAMRRAIKDGDLHAEKAMGKWRVEPAELLAWLRSADDYEDNGAPRRT